MSLDCTKGGGGLSSHTNITKKHQKQSSGWGSRTRTTSAEQVVFCCLRVDMQWRKDVCVEVDVDVVA